MSENNFVKLGDVAHECRLTWSGGQTDIPIVGLEHLVPGEIELSSWDSNIEHTFSKKFLKGQVLLGRRRVYLKKAVVAPCDGICSGDITVIESTGGILPELLPFVIQNDRFFDYAMQGSAGSLSPRVKWEHLKNYEFSLPPLAEQKVLADKLWAAYRLKESYKKLLAATEEMVKSQFIEMFGTIDTPHYDTVTLTTISENLDSMRIPIKSGNRVDGQYPYYGASGIVDYVGDYIFDDDILLISEDGANLKDRVTPIAFSSSGKVWVNNHAHVLRFKDANLQRYVECYFNYNRIDKYLTGTAQPKLNQDKLNSIPIPLPSGEVLTKFISIYNQADKSGFELRKSIDAIDAVIKSLVNS